MKVLNLRCGAQHLFEGWFGSEADFQAQRVRGLVSCPMCGDADVEKMLSAPRLNLGGCAPEAPSGTASNSSATPTVDHPARMWQALRTAMAQAEDVGERFADEARRMHQGDTRARAIRGNATRADTIGLLEEGIPVLPLPAAFKETLQ